MEMIFNIFLFDCEIFEFNLLITQLSCTGKTYSKVTFQFVMAMGTTRGIDLDQLHSICTITELRMMDVPAKLENIT